MSGSNRLRKTHTEFGGGKVINNENAKKHENKVRDSMLEALECLRILFPNAKIILKNTISLIDIMNVTSKRMDRKCSSFWPESGTIKPDGGIMYFVVNDMRLPILISEAKKQGTNDVRLLEGKSRQSVGNACERTYKNTNLIEKMLPENIKIMPYILFFSGCDFTEEVALRKIGALTLFDEPNKVYVNDETDVNGEPHKKFSVFLSVEGFTKEYMTNILLYAAIKAIIYFSEKYNFDLKYLTETSKQ